MTNTKCQLTKAKGRHLTGLVFIHQNLFFLMVAFIWLSGCLQGKDCLLALDENGESTTETRNTVLLCMAIFKMHIFSYPWIIHLHA
jgi:hypothetical protein